MPDQWKIWLYLQLADHWLFINFMSFLTSQLTFKSVSSLISIIFLINHLNVIFSTRFSILYFFHNIVIMNWLFRPHSFQISPPLSQWSVIPNFGFSVSCNWKTVFSVSWKRKTEYIITLGLIYKIFTNFLQMLLVWLTSLMKTRVRKSQPNMSESQIIHLCQKYWHF